MNATQPSSLRRARELVLPILALSTQLVSAQWGWNNLQVQIEQPREGDTFTAPADITICARAREYNGSIISVQFFANSTSLGIVTSGQWDQFCLLFSNVPPGNFALTAVATDNHGVMATSAPVNITVTSGTQSNQPPQVQIGQPRDGDTFIAPANITICAQAKANNNGTIVSVEFFESTNSLGVVINGSNDQFCLLFSNVPPGSFTLTAKRQTTKGPPRLRLR